MDLSKELPKKLKMGGASKRHIYFKHVGALEQPTHSTQPYPNTMIASYTNNPHSP